MKRIPKDGSGPLEIIQSGETGGFALTSFGDASYIYWTNSKFGAWFGARVLNDHDVASLE